MSSHSSKITIERIERAMLTLAIIIENDGEVYLPIFERLERELEAARRSRSALERARSIVAEARVRTRSS